MNGSPSVRVALFIRESGSESPCRWFYVTGIYNQAVKMQSEYLFNDENGQQGTWLTYDKYRGRFKKIMKKLSMEHKPHDTRHSFITKAKDAGINEYILKLIVGHEIQDITEKVYTHRTLEDMKTEIQKIE